MKSTVLTLVVLIPAMVAWPQAEQSVFDPETFFAPAGSAVDEAGETATLRAASRTGLDFSGDAGADVLYTILEPFDDDERTSVYTGATALRLDASGGDRKDAKVEASVLVRLGYGVAAAPVLSFELKKLYLSVYTPLADISAGRMVINYGRGTIFSPVDLFSAVDTSDLGLGRAGTDALRVQVPFGDFSGLDLVATLGRSTGDGIAGARVYGNVSGLDLGVSAFSDGLADGSGDLVAGLDFKGDLVLGISGEAVARVPLADWQPDATGAVYSLMLGVDYSFAGEWFVDAEYLWNASAGDAVAAGSFSSGQNLSGSLSWKPDELTALDLRCIMAPRENALQATVSLSRSVASGANLISYAQYQRGDVAGHSTESLGLGLRLSVAY